MKEKASGSQGDEVLLPSPRYLYISKVSSAFSSIKLKLRQIEISYRLLRRIVLAFVSIAILVVIIVVNVKNAKERRRVEMAGDYPDFDDPKDRMLGRKVLSSKIDFPFAEGCRVPDVDAPRANASFVVLARNSEVDDVISSMKSMERHFNQWFNYPWVFLNDEEFDDNFKSSVKQYTNAEVEFGIVPKQEWDFKNVDPDLLHESIESQGDRGIMYGNMPSYHKMCRFYLGYFYHHPLVTKREWYWRVEPDVKFFCDLTYDPFIEMQKNNKKYGFTVMIHELYYTVPSLFLETKAFIKEYQINVQSAWDMLVTKYRTVTGANSYEYSNTKFSNEKDLDKSIEKNINLKKFLAMKNKKDRHLAAIKEFRHVRDVFEEAYEKPNLFEDKIEDEEYNLCHFWTNFEIARTDLFTSKTYQDYFAYLEASGGFYRERWGDAPVHSLAVAMMLRKDEIHYFRDIGYKHTTLGHCPNNAPGKQLPYEPSGAFMEHSEVKPWYHFFRKDTPDEPVKNGVGCRCVCPYKHRELEDRNSDCIKQFANVVSDGYKSQRPINLDAREKLVEKRINRYLKQGGQLGKVGLI